MNHEATVNEKIGSKQGFWRGHLLAGALLLGLALAGLSACGDASDKPEDCTAGEYYNEAQSLCTACPAAVEPQCRQGCGFQIVEDDNGCPVTECVLECKCAAGQFFSTDSFSCERCAEAANPPAICAGPSASEPG